MLMEDPLLPVEVDEGLEMKKRPQNGEARSQAKRLRGAEKQAKEEERQLLRQKKLAEKLAEKERLLQEKLRAKAEKEAAKEAARKDKEEHQLEKQKEKAIHEAEKERIRAEKEAQRLEKEERRLKEIAEKEQKKREKEENEQKQEAIAKRQAQLLAQFLTTPSPASKYASQSPSTFTRQCQGTPPTTKCWKHGGALDNQEMAYMDSQLATETMSAATDLLRIMKEARLQLWKQQRQRRLLRYGREGITRCCDSYRRINTKQERRLRVFDSSFTQEEAQRPRHRKLIQFHENTRPAFFGSFSKHSSFIGPRHPLVKDEALDYTVDSDDEWEEEEPGESLSESEKDDDEDDKGDATEDEADGFMVPDGYLSEDEGNLIAEDLESDQDEDEDGSCTFTEGGPALARAEDTARRTHYLEKLHKVLVAATEQALRSSPLLICNFLQVQTKQDEATSTHSQSVHPRDPVILHNKSESAILEALSIRVLQPQVSIEVPSTSDVGPETAHSEGRRGKAGCSFPGDCLPTLVKAVLISTPGSKKLLQSLGTLFPGVAKRHIKQQLQNIADFTNNQWQDDLQSPKLTNLQGKLVWQVKLEVLKELQIDINDLPLPDAPLPLPHVKPITNFFRNLDESAMAAAEDEAGLGAGANVAGAAYFPSKAGGVPAWLDPDAVPGGRRPGGASCGGGGGFVATPLGLQAECGFCGRPMHFLAQVYAPGDGGEQAAAFHRTVFVFVCRSMACLRQDQCQQHKAPSTVRGGNGGPPCRSVRVFRNQLPRDNVHYAYDPPQSHGLELPRQSRTSNEKGLRLLGGKCTNGARRTAGAVLCTWCGTWRGSQRCGGCHQAHYCSRIHQSEHWKASHAAICRQVQSELGSVPGSGSRTAVERPSPGSDGASPASVPAPLLDSAAVDSLAGLPLALSEVSKGQSHAPDDGPARLVVPGIVPPECPQLWPELELFVEDEADCEVDLQETGGSGEGTVGDRAKQLLEEYHGALRRRAEVACSGGDDHDDLEEAGDADKEHWASFQARLSRNPTQVLRSEKARVLWPRLDSRPTSDQVPSCLRCGSARTFEFQILPQILYFLKIGTELDDALDFGTLAVYTCPRSCTTVQDGNCTEEYLGLPVGLLDLHLHHLAETCHPVPAPSKIPEGRIGHKQLGNHWSHQSLRRELRSLSPIGSEAQGVQTGCPLTAVGQYLLRAS
eukprot:SM000304S11847  [mRNA]  locus=s304:56432:67298:+ [translate_table: standard]